MSADEARQMVSLRARALLLPTPLAAVDPDGEEGRATRVETWLEGAGFAKPTEEDKELLDRCARDAHDAQVGGLVPDVAARGDSAPVLRHPLSGDACAGAATSVEDARAAFGQVLREIEQLARDGSPASDPVGWYAKLWLTVMQHNHVGALSRVPGSAVLPDHTVLSHRSLTAALLGARGGGGGAALLRVHVGPVQGFIAAARRTHDLWVGSYTVALLTYRAVEAVARLAGPDAVVHPDLSSLRLYGHFHGEGSVAAEEVLRAALGNRFLAIVPRDRCEELAGAAARAVVETWKGMGQAVRGYLENLNTRAGAGSDVWKGWERQMADLPEVDAVALPWPETRAEVSRVLDRLGLDDPAAALGRRVSDDATGLSYGALFSAAHRLLGAHRHTHVAAKHEGDARPKCCLCGEREQMGPNWGGKRASRGFWEDLSRSEQRERSGSGGSGGSADNKRLSLHLALGEGLCAVCLTKRFVREQYLGSTKGGLGLRWSNKEQDRPLLRFPSVASVASAPFRNLWMERLQRGCDGGKLLLRHTEDWRTCMGELHEDSLLQFDLPGNLLPGLGSIGCSKDEDPLRDADGQWLYRDAYVQDRVWRDFFGRIENDTRGKERYQKLAEPLSRADAALGEVSRMLGARASSYYAVLVMDGDRMGRWVTGRHNNTPRVEDAWNAEAGGPCPGNVADHPRPLFPALHGEIARRLGRLAGGALHEVVERRHLGRVVYCGGDDLLALLPLETALACMRDVRATAQKPEHLGVRVTWSAGLAVAHIREPLGRTVEQARKAEKAAKEAGRDAVSVRVLKRSGAPLRLVLPWHLRPDRGAQLDVLHEVAALVGASLTSLGAAARADDEGDLVLRAAYQLRRNLRAYGPRSGGEGGHGETGDGRDDRVPRTEVFLCDLRRALGQRVSVVEALLTEPRGRGPEGRRRDPWLDPAGAVDLLLLVRFLRRERLTVSERDVSEPAGAQGGA